eukprot:scaffold5597_cov105-Isochrysis_galbana.AAC.4
MVAVRSLNFQTHSWPIRQLNYSVDSGGSTRSQTSLSLFHGSAKSSLYCASMSPDGAPPSPSTTA